MRVYNKWYLELLWWIQEKTGLGIKRADKEYIDSLI